MKSTKMKVTRLLLTLGAMLLGILLAVTMLYAPNARQASAWMDSGYEEVENSNSSTPYEPTEERDFSGNLVIITLTQPATHQFLDYASACFPEVNAVYVSDLTHFTVGWVRKQVLGIPSSETMLINVERFRRILSIELYEYCKENVLNAVYILSKREDVQSAGPSYTQKIMSTITNDTIRNAQWALDNINVNQAWDFTTGSPSVKVGVLDSGIYGGHPNLSNRIHHGNPHNESTTLHRDFTTDEKYGVAIVNPIDPNGHGTHVAGIIGAQGGNNLGIAGVALNIRLVSLRVFDFRGFAPTLKWLFNAINYAASVGIPILNYSGGGPGNVEDIRVAIEAYTGLFVAASGNNFDRSDDVTAVGFNNDKHGFFPANYRLSNLISVGSIDENNSRSWFSNFGYNTVDIYAPGSSIRSTVPVYSWMWPFPWTLFAETSGTSMAAPHVAGVAALMLSANPDFTGEDLKNSILSNAKPITISVPIRKCSI
jgi:subtilisin family serine protease